MKYFVFLLFAFVCLPAFAQIAKPTPQPPVEAPPIPAPPAQEAPKNRGSNLNSYGGVMGGGMSFLPPMAPTITYGGSLAPEKSAPEVSQQRLNFATPVYRDKAQDFSMSVTGGTLHFGDDLVLSKTGTELKRDFYRAELGLQYNHTLPKERSWGLRGSIGSSSDRLFSNTRDLTFNLNASYSYSGAENSRWIYFVFFANNSPILNYTPIPGFMYFYKTPKFTGMFGLPVISLQWMPIDLWYSTLSLFGPTINTEVGYGLPGSTQYMFGANWTQQSYLRDGREKNQDRLFLDEKRVFIGLRTTFFSVPSEFQIGQNFDRSVYEGKGFSKKNGGSVDLKDSWSVSWNLRYSF